MALILYTLTLEKIRSIALLKLIGAPTYWILGMIFQQSLVLGALGYCIAYVAGQKVFPYFPRRVILTNEDLLQLAIVVLIVSISSCSLGIWKTLHIHPSEVLSG
jgi:putative ABC transport system permease protein